MLFNPYHIKAVSALLTDIEHDQNGVQVLIRQYLKLGGRMLGFNIDTQINDVVDCLIRVDLRETDPKILYKYMRRDTGQTFIDYHTEPVARLAERNSFRSESAFTATA